ncbi:MAG: hypothetical protein OEW80_11655, partial [Gemmatimonadota bacterium]|nr:hypothetical protein [Gemmatimonadota bacterium]
SRFDEEAPALSPDGRWLAYVSNESGTPEVYVRPFPRTDEARFQVSRAGGATPKWSRSGRELFFESSNGELMVASVRAGAGFVTDEPRALFNRVGVFVTSNVVPYYDLSPDDRRFMMVRVGSLDQEASGGGKLIVVENWLQELKDKVEEGQR